MKQRKVLKNPDANWKKIKEETYHFYQVTVKWIAWLGELGSFYNLPTPSRFPSPKNKNKNPMYVLFSERKVNCKETYRP